MKEIRFEEVSKSFGENLILKKISFALEQGKIYGLIGKNGSGKTTIFCILSKLISSFQGKVLVNGLNIFDPINDYKNFSFFFFSDFTFPSKMKVEEYVNECIKLRELKNSVLEEVLSDNSTPYAYIWKRKRNLCSDLSSDLKQMLQFFIMEMLEKSNKLKFVFLDEPFKIFRGLLIDNKSQITEKFLDSKKRIIEKILNLKKNGTLIFISSDNLNDLQFLTDNFIFLDNSFITLSGDKNSDIIEKTYDNKISERE